MERSIQPPLFPALSTHWAFVDLGILYSVGRSVAIDRVRAHKWFNIAASRGCHEAAGLRQELASEMTRAEIAEAQRYARLWLASH